MKALIIGKSGQVAWELMQTIPCGVTTQAVGRDDINIVSLESVQQKITDYQPDVVINASAYTAVDQAETEQEQAFAINQIAVKNMAMVCQQQQIRLLHISTDFVFDGEKNTAYNINDKTNPVSVYGASKLAGEQEITAHHLTNSAIVRTSWVYSSHGSNFVKTMLRLMKDKPQLGVVCDQIGCPTYAKGLAQFLWQLAQQQKVNPLYHWSDFGVASWYDFAVAIQDEAFNLGLLDKKIPIKPIPSSSYPTLAKRPNFSLMQTTAETELTTANLSYWRDNLISTLECL